MKVYPNPFTNELTIEQNSENSQNKKLEIINQLGQVVYKTDSFADNKTIKIDLSQLVPGYYIVRLSTNSSVSTSRIFKTF